jgi:hypothetical protein
MNRVISATVYFHWLLLVGLTLSISQLQAQLKPVKQYDGLHSKRLISRVELLAGANFIYTKEKYDENRVEKYGYTFGLNLAHSFGESPLDINLKLGYEQKGWNSMFYSPYNPTVTQKVIRMESLNYITLSLFALYSPIKNLSIGFGAYYGHLNRFILKYELYFNDSLVSKFSGRPDPSPSFKRSDAGTLFVIRYDFKVKGKQIFIQIENNLGLYLINQPVIEDKANRTYSVLIGIPIHRFNILKTKIYEADSH